MIERLEVRARGGRQYAGGAEALVRRLSAVVDPVDAGAGAVLGHELLHGLEEVDVQAREPIDAGELGIGRLGGEAIIADEVPHDRAVLLLDVGAVVLLPGATAGEGDPARVAVVVQALVDELAAVVTVYFPVQNWRCFPAFPAGSVVVPLTERSIPLTPALAWRHRDW